LNFKFKIKGSTPLKLLKLYRFGLLRITTARYDGLLNNLKN